jgi:hypothetical protein
MLSIGFKPTIPEFERAKTVHSLDRAVTAIGYAYLGSTEMTEVMSK